MTRLQLARVQCIEATWLLYRNPSANIKHAAEVDLTQLEWPERLRVAMSDWIEQYSAALTERDAREQAHKPYMDACMPYCLASVK